MLPLEYSRWSFICTVVCRWNHCLCWAFLGLRARNAFTRPLHGGTPVTQSTSSHTRIMCIVIISSLVFISFQTFFFISLIISRKIFHSSPQHYTMSWNKQGKKPKQKELKQRQGIIFILPRTDFQRVLVQILGLKCPASKTQFADLPCVIK